MTPIIGSRQAEREAWADYTDAAYQTIDVPQNDYLTHRYRHRLMINLLDETKLPTHCRRDPTVGFYTKQLIEKIKNGTNSRR